MGLGVFQFQCTSYDPKQLMPLYQPIVLRIDPTEMKTPSDENWIRRGR